MSPASARVQVYELVPSEILHLPWTSKNLTVQEKLILHLLWFTFAQLSAPSNEVKREKFHSHSHLWCDVCCSLLSTFTEILTFLKHFGKPFGSRNSSLD